MRMKILNSVAKRKRKIFLYYGIEIASSTCYLFHILILNITDFSDSSRFICFIVIAVERSQNNLVLRMGLWKKEEL